jgi:hypothetical protein
MNNIPIEVRKEVSRGAGVILFNVDRTSASVTVDVDALAVDVEVRGTESVSTTAVVAAPLRDLGVSADADSHHGRCDDGSELHADEIGRSKSADKGRMG